MITGGPRTSVAIRHGPGVPKIILVLFIITMNDNTNAYLMLYCLQGYLNLLWSSEKLCEVYGRL